ncbi:MAG: efflux RND transporter periplasmic adaptor subunit [Bacteroidales bacterium]
MIRERIRLALLGFILLPILIGCSGNESSEDKSKQAGKGLPVEAYIVDSKPLNQALSLSGTLIAGEEVELKAETTGKLVEFRIVEGRTVKKGQLLARVNDSEIRARLEKLRSDLKLAEDDLSRNQRLREINALSQQDLDVSKNRVDGIKADIQLAKAQIQKAEIRAPFDGRIGLRNVSPGSSIGTNTVLATLIQDNPLRLEFSVPERYVHGVKTGKEITFTLGQNPKEFKANIYATESVIDQQTRALRVRAKCPNQKGELIPGAFARVSFNINGSPKTMLVPPHAIVPVLGGQNVVIASNSNAKFVPVETGVRTATAVEIVSGIQPGDTLLTSGLLQVREGTLVDIEIIDSW